MKSRILCYDIGEICDNCANGELYPCATWRQAEYAKQYLDGNVVGYNENLSLKEKIKSIVLNSHKIVLKPRNIHYSFPTDFGYYDKHLLIYKAVIENWFPEHLEIFENLLLLK